MYSDPAYSAWWLLLPVLVSALLAPGALPLARDLIEVDHDGRQLRTIRACGHCGSRGLVLHSAGDDEFVQCQHCEHTWIR